VVTVNGQKQNDNTFFQNETHELKISKSGYSANGTGYDSLFLQIINKTDSSLITWIEKENIANFTDEMKVIEYFIKAKGDFSLFDLTWEQFDNKIPVELYFTFYNI
jgi:ABC-type transport system involved in cytochrome bd biosynthesis fused ATPase/permease subunit